MEVARFAWKVKLALHLELDLMGVLRDKAEEEAIQVFARNLKDLLLAAPAGAKATLGLDPPQFGQHPRPYPAQSGAVGHLVKAVGGGDGPDFNGIKQNLVTFRDRHF